MRSLVLAVVLFVIPNLRSETFTYIIPVSGSIINREAFYFGSVRVINVSGADATVEVSDLIREPATRPCSPTPPVTLHPGQVGRVGSDYRDPCLGIYSLVLQSDHEVFVRSEVTTYGDRGSVTEQRIDVAVRWVEAGEEAFIADVEIVAFAGVRGNLFITNPNPFPIEARLTVDRPELGLQRQEIVTVGPHSLRQYGVAEIEIPARPPGMPIVYSYLHNITIEATGMFQAGASSVGSRQGAYRPAVILR